MTKLKEQDEYALLDMHVTTCIISTFDKYLRVYQFFVLTTFNNTQSLLSFPHELDNDFLLETNPLSRAFNEHLNSRENMGDLKRTRC